MFDIFPRYSAHGDEGVHGDRTGDIIMSEQTAEQFVEELKRLDLVVKLGIALLVGAFGLGVWVATLEFRTGETEVIANESARTIDEMRLWKAETISSRFTLQDFMKANQLTVEQANIMDKRTAHLEDDFARIEKTLERIDAKLNKP